MSEKDFLLQKIKNKILEEDIEAIEYLLDKYLNTNFYDNKSKNEKEKELAICIREITKKPKKHNASSNRARLDDLQEKNDKLIKEVEELISEIESRLLDL